jgi:hypothetical protein
MTHPDLDQVDASLIAAIVRGFQEWERVTRRPPATKVLREALWFFWQKPRLGRRIRGKYPLQVPWTAAARIAYAADPRCPLIIEHVRPVNLLVRQLLSGDGSDEEILKVLREVESFCVVTPEEDRALQAAGVAANFEGDDPWDRYALAEIAIAGTGPA